MVCIIKNNNYICNSKGVGTFKDIFQDPRLFSFQRSIYSGVLVFKIIIMEKGDKVYYAKYLAKKSVINGNDYITKDGHTMFTGDVVTDLNRKSYLEQKCKDQEKEIERLKSKIEDSETKRWDLYNEFNEELTKS